MDINKFLKSKALIIVAAVIAGLIILLLMIDLGMHIGFRKADFSYKWAENYHQNFAGPRGGFMADARGGREFNDGHGVFGPIIKIDPAAGQGQAATVIIKGRNDVEQMIIVGADTIIKKQNSTLQLSDLKVDDNIVVIGTPNNAGQVEAKLIRVMLSPPVRPTGQAESAPAAPALPNQPPLSN